MSKLSKKIKKLFLKKKKESDIDDIDTFSSGSSKTGTYFSTDKGRFIKTEIPEKLTIVSPSIETLIKRKDSISDKSTIYTRPRSSTYSDSDLYSNIGSSSDNFFKHMYRDSYSDSDSDSDISNIFKSRKPSTLSTKSTIYSSKPSRSSSISSDSSNIFRGNKTFTSKSDSAVSDDSYLSALSDYYN